jgi:hypothetical protein
MLFVALLSLASLALADDPAASWLAYAQSKGDTNTNSSIVTKVTAKWTVPASPSSPYGSNAPGFWFGIEPQPADALIQPILAYGDMGADYTLFNGYFYWPDQSWWQSSSIDVSPGDAVSGGVELLANHSYNMWVQADSTGQRITSNIAISGDRIYTNVFFVLEHQPELCAAYPSNNEVVFTDIVVERAGKVVADPKWIPATFKPACSSNTTIVSPTSVKFTWDSSWTKEDRLAAADGRISKDDQPFRAQ